jgi:ATP-dependent Lon protease
MAVGIYSAIYRIPVDHKIAMTGEISIHGNVKPIGGVVPKVKAAKQAGATCVIIPADNMQSILQEFEGIEILPVKHVKDVFEIALNRDVVPDDILPQLNLPKKESV